ncbi:hypothetical protein [Adhaeribacter terreus]|uniref:GNAT family N-acetyltransferase n=1 Tax=Adhaeribacter terreus TaxID=529703 RepID=A0ABW0E801_9BACT
MEQVIRAFNEQAERLLYYSPYNYLRELGRHSHFNFLLNQLQLWLNQAANHFTFNIEINGAAYSFLYHFLPWDSDHFQVSTCKLFTVLYPENNFVDLVQAVAGFLKHLHSNNPGYFFGEIPAEDSLLLQAFTASGFRLSETRLNYYFDQVQTFESERFPVRVAGKNDIDLIKKVASQNRNPFDRYHADIFFTPEQADNYLATYAEACQKGLADLVLLPGENERNSEAFMAILRHKQDAEQLNTSFARILLTAVSPDCKGWHLKLASETIQFAKEWNTRYVLMTTQATNRAVFRTSEKLGFKLGSTTHLLSITI